MSALFRRRNLPWPTPLGWTLFCSLILGLMCAFVFGVHPFLGPTEPLGGELLIVEGWVDAEALKHAIARHRAGGYQRILTTGGPLEAGWPLAVDVHDYANLAAARLVRLGLPADAIEAVPAPPSPMARTRAAARAVRVHLVEHHPEITRVDLLTVAVHARRSWRIYLDELAPRVRVGVIATPPVGYAPARWWQTSSGTRAVVGESLAYLHGLLF